MDARGDARDGGGRLCGEEPPGWVRIDASEVGGLQAAPGPLPETGGTVYLPAGSM